MRSARSNKIQLDLVWQMTVLEKTTGCWEKGQGFCGLGSNEGLWEDLKESEINSDFLFPMSVGIHWERLCGKGDLAIKIWTQQNHVTVWAVRRQYHHQSPELTARLWETLRVLLIPSWPSSRIACEPGWHRTTCSCISPSKLSLFLLNAGFDSFREIY